MNTLIVEDDPTVRDLLAQSLRRQGHKNVTTAQSANEAMKLLASSREFFECFLIDIEMPQTNGIELCRAVRNTTGYKTTPILMITTTQNQSAVYDAFAAGASDFIMKPLDGDEIRERLHFADIIKDPAQARQLALMRATHKLQHDGSDDATALPVSLHIPDLGAANIDRPIPKRSNARRALSALFSRKPKNDR